VETTTGLGREGPLEGGASKAGGEHTRAAIVSVEALGLSPLETYCRRGQLSGLLSRRWA
jgi:hypothetical protein